MSKAEGQGFKRKLQGVVVSDGANKTITVKVDRKFKHPIYSKFVTTSKKYHAHDEANSSKVGDVVVIMESRPISKLKKWVLVSKK